MTGKINRDIFLLLVYTESAKHKSEMAIVYRDLCKLYTGGKRHERNRN